MCLQLHYNKQATTAKLVWNPLNISTRITLSKTKTFVISWILNWLIYCYLTWLSTISVILLTIKCIQNKMCLQLHYNKQATTATLVWNPLNISTRITLSILNFVRSVRYLWNCSRLMSLQLITADDSSLSWGLFQLYSWR
jgi:hypothetical protein